MPAIQSMTGFASLEGEHEGLTYQFDARSVNGRSLDVRLRLPPALERHEPELRRLVAGKVRRGTLTLSLSLRNAEGTARYEVDRSQLAAYLAVIEELMAAGKAAPPSADGLLALRGVIDAEREDTAGRIASALPRLAAELMADLVADRTEEGARIAPLLSAQLAEMRRLSAAIETHPERSMEAIKARIAKQLADLLEPSNALSSDRLHQEAALLSSRGDVREELDRLKAHIDSADALIAEGGPLGRKLDFLAQELHRETNTICAKASHHSVTALGLDLKAVVEQMREQVQNLE